MPATNPKSYCLLYGNPIDGFRVIGPFDSFDDAREYRDSDPEFPAMWIAEMDVPADD